MEKQNKLIETVVYLAGPIEAAKDFGYGWRDKVTTFMKERKIKVLDPCHKVFMKDIKETDSANAQMQEWRRTGDFDQVATRMKEIRIYDLKMVDVSDFIFAYINVELMTCGTWEEIFWANRMKKPIFLICEQGRNRVPLWMFGTMPHKYFYDSVDDALEVLAKIDDGEIELDSDRWKLFQPQFR